MIDYFKEAEKILTDLPMLKASVENLQKRKTSLSGIAAEPPPRTGKTHRAELTKSEEIWLDYRQTEKQIGYTRIVIEHIEQTLQQLDAEERIVLIFWYVDHAPKEKILTELHYESLTSLYNIKNRAVGLLCCTTAGGYLPNQCNLHKIYKS